jgi:PhnB protein
VSGSPGQVELIHAEVRIGDSVVMITQEAVDGPARSPDQLGGMVTCVMALYWQDVATAWERAVTAGAKVMYPPGGSVLRRARRPAA